MIPLVIKPNLFQRKKKERKKSDRMPPAKVVSVLQCVINVPYELTHWTRPWCWEGLGAGGEGDDRGWDGWMSSPTPWTWVWVNSESWWWTGRPGVLWFMGSQRVGHDWATELNWTELKVLVIFKMWRYFLLYLICCNICPQKFTYFITQHKLS